MSAPVLDVRALNRATLARQHLLGRSGMTVPGLLQHLVGLQAQTANSWYTGLWSRLEAFDPTEVSRLLTDRKIVRIALMRSTLHLVTDEDALTLRPALQRAVERPMTGYWRRTLADLHAEEVAAAGRALLEQAPLTNIELGARLAEQWPEYPPSDLAMAVRVWVPLVQVPPRGVWGESGTARHAPLEHWLGQPLGRPVPVETLVLRYLAAFGPATPADAQIWSGLSGLREAFERLSPQLSVFTDEQGRRLFDLPDAPRPDADTLAPVRFIYDYDNLLLSHADRSRFASSELRAWLTKKIGMYSYGSVLVDGFVRGLWRIERERERARLVVKLLEPVADEDRQAVAEEGARLLEFWTPGQQERELAVVALEGWPGADGVPGP